MSTPDLSRIQRSLNEGEEKRRFSANDYLRLLWKGKWIIGACVAVAALLTAYYTYSLPFIYESTLDIAVNEKDQEPIFGQTMRMMSRDRALKNELKFMTAPIVYEKTALQLVTQRYLDTNRRGPGDSLIPIISATETAMKARLHGLSPDAAMVKKVVRVADLIENMVVVSPSKDADIVTITTRCGDYREAALIANTYAEIYVLHSRDENQTKTRDLLTFIQDKLDTTREMLLNSEDQLKGFKESAGIVGEGLSGAELTSQKANLEQQLSLVDIEINSVAGSLSATEKQLSDIEPTYVSEISQALPEVITSLTQRLAREETAFNHLISVDQKSGSVVAKQRMIRERRKVVEDLRRELQNAVQKYKGTKIANLPGTSDLSSAGPTGPLNSLRGRAFEARISLNTLKAKRSAIAEAIGSINSTMSQIPEKEAKLGQYLRTQKGLEDIFKELQNRHTIQVIDKQAIMSTVRIISPANADTNPISPNRRANLVVGVIVGLGLGIGVVLLVAYSDTTIHSPDELGDKGYSVLAAIPAIVSVARPLARKRDVPVTRVAGSLSPHLIAHSDPDSPITESYRSLRTAIQFASLVEPIRILLVTSSVPQEGKSTTSANLAIVLANSGLRTLLIDCDLRRPIAHANFGLSKEPGLVNALIGELSIEQAIRPTVIPNLSVLSSGSIPPNPSELLGSKRMSEMLDRVAEMYDFVLIDSPPVGVVTDGVILSTKVDATIAVVRAHKTRMEFLDRTNDEISRVGGPLLGVVLNEFDASQSYGSSYKYYRYYKYYGYYGQKDGASDRKRRRAETAKQNAEATN